MPRNHEPKLQMQGFAAALDAWKALASEHDRKSTDGHRVWAFFERVFEKSKLLELLNLEIEQDGRVRLMQRQQTQLIHIVSMFEAQKELKDLRAENDRFRAILDNDGREVYAIIARRIGQTEADFAELNEKYIHEYWYIRYFSPSKDAPKRLRKGEITVRSVGSSVEFNHRSQDWIEAGEKKAEHTGWVFLHGGKLFMLATKPAVIRLSIVEVPPNSDLASDGLNGIVLSLRSGGKKGGKNQWLDPFAAKAVMFHKDCLMLAEFERALTNGSTDLFDQRFECAEGSASFLSL